MAKIKIATDWLAACAGCHMSFLDMDERLVQLLDKIEITSSPITDLKHPPRDGVTVGILTGTVNTTHHLEVARVMRERCQILVSLGDCSVLGGLPLMRNQFNLKEALQRAYVETESTIEGIIPRSEELGKPISARPLDQVVKVDVYLPGCPPSADAIHFVLSELLEGRVPILKDQVLKYD
jgi:NAD-reducing hydrogenase small subunit